ncbi:MAG: hypothetical protein ACLRYY_10410 [Anaerobutyricum soehngenii]
MATASASAAPAVPDSQPDCRADHPRWWDLSSVCLPCFIMGADARIAAWGMVLGEAVSHDLHLSLPTFVVLLFENRSISFQKPCRKTIQIKISKSKKISNKKIKINRILNKSNSDKISKIITKDMLIKEHSPGRQILSPFPQGNF